MGCRISVHDNDLKMKVGKSERQPARTGLSDGVTKRTAPATTTMKRHSEVAFTASSSRKVADLTVSLDVDEYITDEPPKVDSNGHLMPEEVVRRTSSSISDSKILLGDRRRYGKEVRLTVSAIFGAGPVFGKSYFPPCAANRLKLTNLCGQFMSLVRLQISAWLLSRW